jgi:predicted secreted protein
MLKQDKVFSEIYAIDTATNYYMIEVGLDHYADIFNEWDSAPFKRRDIDPDLELYLEGSSDEIPFRYPVELFFVLPAGKRDLSIEAETQKGLKNSFAFKLYLLRKELRKTNTQMIRFVLIGLACLWLGATFSARIERTGVLPTLIEGLLIIGWVFLWEAVSLFFFTNRELHHRYKTYKRLQSAPIIFREAEPLSHQQN